MKVAYADLPALAGKEIGASSWVKIDQAKVNQFADVTGDHQWIHIDVERAKREMPATGTIVHGYFVLSLIPKFMFELMQITGVSQVINYGANKVRFTGMVPVGSNVRGRLKVQTVEPKGKGITMTYEMVIEIEGHERPACVAEVIMMAFP